MFFLQRFPYFIQVTPDGERKIIDLIDCSGSGDVDTSVTRIASDGKILGLSGRELRVLFLQIFIMNRNVIANSLKINFT